MKRIHKLLVALGIATVLSIGVKVYATGVRTIEELQLKATLELSCLRYDTKCTVSYLDSPMLNAMTNPEGTIYITRELVRYLSYNEALSVGLHEVGHVVLRHHERFPLDGTNKITEKGGVIIKQFEFESDAFAALEELRLNSTASGDTALMKITKPEYWGIDTHTHPSTVRRVVKIKRIRNMYNGRKIDVEGSLDSLLLHSKRQEL